VTRFRARPVVLEAHRLRYGDIQGVSDDLPEWFEELIETGVITMVPASEAARVCNPGTTGYAEVKAGSWLVLHPTGDVRLLTDAAIASDYEVIQ
jgi:hypothetical protein